MKPRRLDTLTGLPAQLPPEGKAVAPGATARPAEMQDSRVDRRFVLGGDCAPVAPRRDVPAPVQAAMELLEQVAGEWEALANANQEGAPGAAENAEAVRTLTGWVRQQAGVRRG